MINEGLFEDIYLDKFLLIESPKLITRGLDSDGFGALEKLEKVEVT